MMSRAGVARWGHSSGDRPPASEPLERLYRHLMVVDHLPPTPEIALAILTMVGQEDADLGDLASLVASDPALAARLLRLANGIYFGAARRVTDIRQAVMLLGFARVRELATTLSIGQTLSTAGAHPAARQTWWHSLLVAGTAKLLARGEGLNSEEAFTAGLLHDIGKLVFATRLKDSYWKLVEDARETHQPLVDLEQRAWGCQHGTVGGWLLQLWGLSSTLVEPVARHHDPLGSEAGPNLSAVVGIANRLVEATDAERGTDAGVFEECSRLTPAWFTPAEWERIYGELLADNEALVLLFDR